MATTLDIGRAGEDAAVEYLRSNGFMILERNWRSGRYEIDIIAQKWDTIHFVEVKSRTLTGWSSPEEALTARKANSLRQAARAYLAYTRTELIPQFDLMAVETSMGLVVGMRYIENAIEEQW